MDEIPSRDKLTYKNGFYVNCSALFIDIRGSSKLPERHTRPVLGKLYRAYVSECVAVLNSNPFCREIFITGDCVSGVFDTPKTWQIDEAFNTAAKLNSLINQLNWRLEKKGYSKISCGIGLAWGRALMLKAGFHGSGLNDVIWMGDVVNQASNLCHQGNKDGRLPVQVSNVVHYNLNDHNKNLLRKGLYEANYQGNPIITEMENWLNAQKAK